MGRRKTPSVAVTQLVRSHGLLTIALPTSFSLYKGTPLPLLWRNLHVACHDCRPQTVILCWSWTQLPSHPTPPPFFFCWRNNQQSICLGQKINHCLWQKGRSFVILVTSSCPVPEVQKYFLSFHTSILYFYNKKLKVSKPILCDFQFCTG